MNYAKINYKDIANGEGIRISIFVSGCHLDCKGCFNLKAQNFNYGKPVTQEVIDSILNEAEKPRIYGLSVLGGDPFAPENVKEVLNICTQFKSKYPDKTIYLWSGYTINELLARNNDYVLKLLNLLDLLVDGRFIIEQRDLRLKLRGSKNQRLLYKQDIQDFIKGDRK